MYIVIEKVSSLISMKAAILEKYNKKKYHLVIAELKKPTIKENQILLKVKAAGVNPVDILIARGQIKILFPYKLPLIMGNEVVGEVVEIGGSTTKFQLRDRVFARLPLQDIGAFAEYVAVDEEALAKVPDYLTDVEATCIPLTALTAMQAFALLNIKKGNSIFITGGSGGFGAMAIPLAKYFGLYVITNGNAESKERVLDLDADIYFDYKKTDCATVVQNVDHIIDSVGGKNLKEQFVILKTGGTLVSLKGLPNKAFAERMHYSAYKKLLFQLTGSKLDKLAKRKQQQYHFLFVQSNGKQLEEVARILAEKQIKPSIDRVFSYAEINQALDKVANDSSRGKTVITF